MVSFSENQNKEGKVSIGTCANTVELLWRWPHPNLRESPMFCIENRRLQQLALGSYQPMAAAR